MIIGAATYVVRSITSIGNDVAHAVKDAEKRDDELRKEQEKLGVEQKAQRDLVTRLDERQTQQRKDIDEQKGMLSAVSRIAAKCHSRLFSNPTMQAVNPDDTGPGRRRR